MKNYLFALTLDEVAPKSNVLPIVIPIVVVCVVGLAVLLYFILSAKKRKYNKIRNVEQKYSLYHSILIGECYQMIQKIEAISSANLVYSQYYAETIKTYLDIKNNQDKICDRSIDFLDEYINDTSKKGFKAAYVKAKENIEKLRLQVNALESRLKEIMQPDENARNHCSRVNENLNIFKKKFLVNTDSYIFAVPSIEKVIHIAEKKIDVIDDLISRAEYEEANERLENLQKVIDVLNKMIEQLPKVCSTISNIIPSRINEVEQKYEFLSSRKIPLSYLSPRKTIDNFKNCLTAIENKVLDLKVEEATRDCETLITNIEVLKQNFLAEEKAKDIYEAKFASIYDGSNATLKKIIDLYNEIPNIRNIYKFDEEHNNILTDLKAKEISLTDAKRKLDVNLLTVTKQPYTQIVEKLDKLESENLDVSSYIDSFLSYLKLLKSDCENAYKILNEKYLKLRKHVVMLDLLNINNAEMNASIDNLYSLLDEITITLKTKPIDVTLINKDINAFNNFGDILFNNIDEMFNYKESCEKYFKLLAEYRSNFASVNIDCKQAEHYYNSHNYYEALLVLQKLYKNYGTVNN